MALGDLFAQVKQKASKMYNQFFFDEEAPAPDMQRREAYPPQDGQQAYPQGDAAYQQPQVQSAYQSPYQQAYQQPQQAAYQQPYQQPQQAAYQQPQQAQQPPQQAPQFSAQYQPPQRNRRAQQHAAQPDNVVPISAYQQAHQAQGGYQQPQQAAPQQAYQQQGGHQQPQQAAPQQAYQQPPQQQAQGGYQQPQSPQPFQPQQQTPATGAARIISARGIGDCRSAIMLLRAGDAVVIVMDGITDPAEMRRYVDTLSGACFSLSATITKVSRYGAYFLAPQGMAVYADQATSQMNGAAARPQAQRPAYPPQQPYAPQRAAYQPPVNPYPPQRAEEYGDFDRRMAEQAPRQPFYAREAQQAPQTAFAEQPQSYGYAPDESLEAAQN